MRAITLWQPWASLMALGYKKIETRSWSTKYRGPLLIHAAKRKLDLLAADFLADEYGLSDLPYGKILCRVDLVDVKKITPDNIPDFPELRSGNFIEGNFMWITQNLETFEAIPYSGMQGLWDVPEQVYQNARKG